MPAAILHLSDPKLSESIFAKWSDGRYYLVQVLKCDPKTKRCAVKFEDDTEYEMDSKELHIQLKDSYTDKEELIVCCICDGGESKTPNEIIICDLCLQGYHVKCLHPAIDRDETSLDDPDKQWICPTCVYMDLSPELQSRYAKSTQSTATPIKTPKRQRAKIPKGSAKKALKIEPTTPRTVTRRLPIKKQESKIEESPVNLTITSETLPNGATVEKMAPSVIDAAKTLAEREVNICTGDFVKEVMAVDEITPEPAKPKPTKTKASKKKFSKAAEAY